VTKETEPPRRPRGGATVAVVPSGAGPLAHEPRAPYRALRSRDFRFLLVGVFLGSFGQQMLAVALGWELYERTGSALALGGIGLALIIPVIFLTLPAGHVADHYSRKRVMLIAQLTVAVGTLGLAALSLRQGPLLPIYGCLMLIGGAQAFNNPASSALVAQVIPPDAYESAITWRSSVGQISAVLGPAMGGFLIGVLGGATWVFVLHAVAALTFACLLAFLRVRAPQARPTGQRTLRAVTEGLRFLGRTPILLAAITLDLFAVLLGGATTLLPIFARDILRVGPFGLGWLQAASSLGSVSMALILAYRPALTRAGRTLLLAVAAFGLVTIVFGLSRSFALSFAMLLLLGGLDNISVVIRSTLLLVRTPDALRGRVGAVNSLFIGTSNQLGGFESGVAAQLLGPVGAVVFGGIGTILSVLFVAWYWPEMRALRTLREPEATAA